MPFVNKAMAERQEAIRVRFQEAEEARARLEAAETEYREQIAERSRRRGSATAKRPANKGAQILAELKTQAQQESDRIIKAAQQQIEAERARTVAALRAEVGALAVELASRIVGESLTDDARRGRVVERFLLEVESRAGEAAGAAPGEQVRS